MTFNGQELFAARQFIYSQLAADATLLALGIDEEEADPGASYPRVRFQVQSPGTQSKGVGDIDIMTNIVMLVVAVDEYTDQELVSGYSAAGLSDYVGRIYTQLARQSGTTSIGQTLWCSYDAAFFRTYRDSTTARNYREEGGLYRLLVQD